MDAEHREELEVREREKGEEDEGRVLELEDQAAKSQRLEKEIERLKKRA